MADWVIGIIIFSLLGLLLDGRARTNRQMRYEKQESWNDLRRRAETEREKG